MGCTRWTLVMAAVVATVIERASSTPATDSTTTANITSSSKIPVPDCSLTPTVRYTFISDMLYLEGGGCITLAEIVDIRTDQDGPKGPLYYFDRKSNTISTEQTDTFFLASSLYVKDNTLLQIIGPKYHGTARRLLMASDKDKIVNLRAYGGQILIQGCKVRSFDRSVNHGRGGADKNLLDGRSYISAISEVVVDRTTCTSKNMGEAKLDIIDSKITQLGYNHSESYGVSYEVRGLCDDDSNLEIMDIVSVWGDITDSELAYNYQGAYFVGHQSGLINHNHVHHNYRHGLSLSSDSEDMVITNNIIHRNGAHGIICSKRSNRVTVGGNEVHRNGKVGVMFCRLSNNGLITDNYIHRNDEAGIALFESFHNNILENTVKRNKYGIRLSVGASYNLVHRNSFNTMYADDPKYAIHMFKGSNEPEVESSDGRCRNNYMFQNILISPEETVRLTDADDNLFSENLLRGKWSYFGNSTANVMKNDTCFYRHEDGYPTETDVEVVKDEGDLTGKETSKYGYVVDNSCFDPESEYELPACDAT